jgi:uncharacterized membrane protein HdeD (DUF308 family)
MTKAISFPVLAGGILLLTLGIGASATDSSIWMLVSGVLATVLGLVGLLRTSKTA